MWLVLVCATLSSIGVFAWQVAALHCKWQVSPSTVLSAGARTVHRALAECAFLWVLVTDVPQFVWQVVVHLRNALFRFIPLETFAQAWRELRDSGLAWLRVPAGLCLGCRRGLTRVSYPILGVALCALSAFTLPVVLEVLAMCFGLRRLSTIVSQWAVVWMELGRQCGLALEYFTNIKALVVRIVSALFGFLPIELIRQCVSDVYTALFELAVSPVKGFVHGALESLPHITSSIAMPNFVIPMRPLLPLLFLVGACGLFTITISRMTSRASSFENPGPPEHIRKTLPDFNIRY